MRPLAVLAALCVAGCAHHIECRLHEGPQWRELRTQHFVMLTDLPPGPAHTEALNLEELRLAMRFHFQLPADGDDLTQVVYLADPDELTEFVDLAGIAITSSLPEAGYIVSTWRAPGEKRRSHTLPHELAHRFSQDAFANTASWLEEGLASYLETARFDGPNALWLGDVGDRFGFRGRLRSLPDLWALPPFVELSGIEQALAYASSWVWVHYLVNHEQAKWAAFTELRRKGTDAREAFTIVFPAETWPRLQQQVEAYRDDAAFLKQKLEFKYERRILDENEAQPWRVHMVRVQLERESSRSKEERAPRIAKERALARSLAPTPAPWLLDADDEALDARIAHAQSLPGDYLAQVWLALHFNELGEHAQAEAYAKAALAVRPSGPTAIYQLGYARIFQGDREAGVKSLRRAHELSPGTAQFSWGMARVASIERKCDEVIPWVHRAQIQSYNPEAVASYEKFGARLLEDCRKETK